MAPTLEVDGPRGLPSLRRGEWIETLNAALRARVAVSPRFGGGSGLKHPYQTLRISRRERHVSPRFGGGSGLKLFGRPIRVSSIHGPPRLPSLRRGEWIETLQPLAAPVPPGTARRLPSLRRGEWIETAYQRPQISPTLQVSPRFGGGSGLKLLGRARCDGHRRSGLPSLRRGEWIETRLSKRPRDSRAGVSPRFGGGSGLKQVTRGGSASLSNVRLVSPRFGGGSGLKLYELRLTALRAARSKSPLASAGGVD